MSAVTASELRKVFYDSHRGRETTAVDRFSLEIEKGELVTLLGPSGCGKTTVLRMLAGFEQPSSGKIIIDGKDITEEPANRRNSAMVFQSYALFPHMTVRENIVYGLKFRKVSKEETESRLKSILEVVGLGDYQTRNPHELSGGQQQRVALARALIIQPSLLLFDEPLSNLDAKLRESMRDEIRRIQQKLGITAVYVTHDQSEAMALSDRVVVMNKGRIEQVAKAQTVYLRPATRFVADFMGCQNFLSAKIEREGEGSTLVNLNSVEVSIPFQMAEKAKSGSITVVARPEHVRVYTEKGHSTQVRTLLGTVVGYRYLGLFHEYLVKVSGWEIPLISRMEAGQSEKAVLPGGQVHVSFVASELHLISE